MIQLIQNPFLKQLSDSIERVDEGEWASFYVIKDASVLKKLNNMIQSWKNDLRIADNKENVKNTISDVAGTNTSISNLITNLAACVKENQKHSKYDSVEQSNSGPNRKFDRLLPYE